MKNLHKGILEISFAAILFGLIPIIVKFSSLDIYSLSLGRIIFATLFLAFWIFFTKTKIQSVKQNKGLFFLFGLFHALIIICFFISIKLISTPIAVLLLYAGAIYLVILSKIFLKEKIEKITIFSLVISFVGLFLIFYTPELKNNLFGYLAGFFAGLFMAFVYLIGKILSKKYDPISITFVQNLIALPLMLPLLFLAEFSGTFSGFFTLILLGIFCTAIAFLLLYSGMKKVKGQKVGILLLLEVLTPLILAFCLFNEIPLLREIVGGILIFIGFILLILFSKNPEQLTP